MIQKIESKTSPPVRISGESEEIARCRGSFPYFLRHVKTNDTQRGLGEMPFPDYQFLKNIAYELQHNRLNLIFKPRHMLITWLLSAKRLWKSNFYPYSNPIFMSQGQLYADAVIDRIWFMYERLPEFLRADAERKTSSIKWPKINSEIISLPCTKNAGRSLSSPDITLDEAAFFQWGSETYAAVAPSVDTYGTLDICSTPNGKDPLFYELWTDDNFAKKFNKIDLKWMEHPERDEEWKQEIIAMIGLKRWLREYEKFWFAPLGKAVYGAEWNDFMEKACFDQWKHADLILCGIDRGYHHPAALWTFMNRQDQWCKVREFMPSDMRRDDFIKKVDELSDAYFPDKPVVYYLPYDCDMDESDGQDWSSIAKKAPYNWNVKLTRGGKDERVRRADAVRKQMKIRADKEFAMLVDPACTTLIEGYKGGYCYPKNINAREDEKPEKDGWYDHLQDADCAIADTYFGAPKPNEVLVSPTANQKFDKTTGRPL